MPAFGGNTPRKAPPTPTEPTMGVAPTEEMSMTESPDDLPSLHEFRKKNAHVDREFADARRYLSALHSEDNHGLRELMEEIHRSGRAMNVLAAMAVQALDFAELAADRLGGDVQRWLNEAATERDTAKDERHDAELGGEG